MSAADLAWTVIGAVELVAIVWIATQIVRDIAHARRGRAHRVQLVNVVEFAPPEPAPEPLEPPAPPPPLPVRQQTGPIIAWRSWALVVRKGQPLLRSVVAGVEWDGPILRARATPAERLPLMTPIGWRGSVDPGAFGIFAYNERDRPEMFSWPVVGEVELFGRVVRHERGYRAECARVRRLWLTGEWVEFHHERLLYRDTRAPVELPASFFIEPLASLYQCDVALHPSAKEASRGNR